MEYTVLQACVHNFRKKKKNGTAEVTCISLEKQLPISFYRFSAMSVLVLTDPVLPSTQKP